MFFSKLRMRFFMCLYTSSFLLSTEPTAALRETPWQLVVHTSIPVILVNIKIHCISKKTAVPNSTVSHTHIIG